jgi:hypothetical protein
LKIGSQIGGHDVRIICVMALLGEYHRGALAQIALILVNMRSLPSAIT